MASFKRKARRRSDRRPIQEPVTDTKFEDLGFGTKISRETRRLINKDGSLNVERTGQGWSDIHGYVFLVTIPWWEFFLWITAGYLTTNLIFAGLYLAVGVEQLSGVDQGYTFWEGFAQAFYFSVQTFTTVGYGTLSPVGQGASLIASFEAMVGLLGFALATGVLWGRFSRPSARIGFSQHAIISPYKVAETGEQINSFQFRIVNRRRNQLIDLSVQLTLMSYMKVEGGFKQVFHQLSLERSHVTLFPLNWTIVHPIKGDSPLYGLTLDDLKARHAEFIIVINAFDDTFAQPVHVRSSYRFDEIFWGARFVKIYHEEEDGPIRLEIDKVGLCERAEVQAYPYTPAEAMKSDQSPVLPQPAEQSEDEAMPAGNAQGQET